MAEIAAGLSRPSSDLLGAVVTSVPGPKRVSVRVGRPGKQTSADHELTVRLLGIAEILVLVEAAVGRPAKLVRTGSENPA
jgi:hypothetical protein